MNAQQLIQDIYRAYRGKGLSKTPVWGEEKSNTALAVANRKQRECNTDPDHLWESNFRLTAPNEPGTAATTGTTALTGTNTHFTDYVVGDKITILGETERIIDTITSDTALTVTAAFSNTASGLTFTRKAIVKAALQEYSLHRSFFVPSDKVTVTTTTSNDVHFGFLKPQRRDDHSVYIYGRHPKKLVFNSDIESTAQEVGGELKVPGYFVPDDMVASTDLVSVDDPNWLVYATAAELARNDAAKDDQFANLLGMANDLFTKMVKANNSIGFLQGGTMPYNTPQIGALTDDWS